MPVRAGSIDLTFLLAKLIDPFDVNPREDHRSYERTGPRESTYNRI